MKMLSALSTVPLGGAAAHSWTRFYYRDTCVAAKLFGLSLPDIENRVVSLHSFSGPCRNQQSASPVCRLIYNFEAERDASF
jgi:hypothetical protein